MIKKKTNTFSQPSQEEMKVLEVLYNAKKFNELETEAQKLIKKHPNVSPLLNILGLALHKLGHLNAAVINYEQAIIIDPKFAFAHNNLGNVFKDLGKFEEALSKYQHSIKLNPNYAEAYYNKALVYKKMHKYNESIESFQYALKIKPDYLEAYFDLGFMFITVSKFKEAIENFQKAINLKPDFSSAYSNILFTLLYLEEYDPEYYFSQTKKFISSLKPINDDLLPKYQFNIKPKKLKIGFISGDFKQHPIGYFLLNTLKHLKKKDLELVAYSNSLKKDDLSTKLISHFTSWREIANQSDETVINQIRKDGIHILFDLAGHSSKNRLSIFFNKPAPIQVSWAGYNASTGIPEIDYFLGDSIVTPASEINHYTEKIFPLPNIWVCFTAPNFEIKLSQLPAIENGYITFGSFNNLSKINNKVISLWSKILIAIPKAKIFLKTKELNSLYLKKMIINNFKKNGINSDSIILEGSSPREELLACYNRVDIALDPFPYSGNATSFEAIWMGVPILTKKGSAFISHSTESINYNCGMPDWIADDENEYVKKAIKFSNNLKQLSEIKKNLRKIALDSPLFNASLFAEQFNKALWEMWNNFLTQDK